MWENDWSGVVAEILARKLTTSEAFVAAIKQRIEQNIELVSPEFYLKQWYSIGGQATDSFMQMMTAGARAAAGETPAKKG